MLCLIKSQVLLHIIDTEHPFPVDKGIHMIEQYNELVKGWIFGSVNESVLKDVVDSSTAQEVWMKLESHFDSPLSDSDREGPVEFLFQEDLLAYLPELEEADNIRRKRLLYITAVEGYWWKAKSILKVHKKAATEAIKGNGDTILHVAVEVGQNYFVENLLEFLENREDIKTQNSKGRTALHIAAMVDNVRAAQLLVQKSSQLLVIRDHNNDTPTDIAFSDMKFNTSAYFLKTTTSFYSINLNVSEDNATNAIVAAIYTKQYDLARSLLHQFPDIARYNSNILFMFVITFPTDLGLMESVIYPCISQTIFQISVYKHC